MYQRKSQFLSRYSDLLQGIQYNGVTNTDAADDNKAKTTASSVTSSLFGPSRLNQTNSVLTHFYAIGTNQTFMNLSIPINEMLAHV